LKTVSRCYTPPLKKYSIPRLPRHYLAAFLNKIDFVVIFYPDLNSGDNEMAKNLRGKRPCSICHKWFQPDVHQKGRLKTCGPDCKKELRVLSASLIENPFMGVILPIPKQL